MNHDGTFVAAIVGIDGCGKSSAFRHALEGLARSRTVVGIGDGVLVGGPGRPPHAAGGLPLRRATEMVSRRAKQTRSSWLYRQLKSLDLIGRARMRDHIEAVDRPAVLLTDGDPLANTLSWSVGRLYADELLRDDERVLDVAAYLAGERAMPAGEIPFYLRHAWLLVLLNRLRIARFRPPHLVIQLRLDGATAMERIRGRGRPLQTHETSAALDALGAGYDRVCGLLQARMGVPVLSIDVGVVPEERTAELVEDAVVRHLPNPAPRPPADPAAAPIEVVATTISGSLQDQRKVGRIGPTFERLVSAPIRVHIVDSHAEARSKTAHLVAQGARTIVSAGGAGTFNAVLEGCHLDGRVPDDMRLAFLRKGSADLIGKAMRIPDDLDDAIAAIADGIEHDRRVRADITAVDQPSGFLSAGPRHLIGFGGLGVFGAVPRFTEARWVKLYKGVLGTLFGDYGPFYTGLLLAIVWWCWQLWRGRIAPLELMLDAERIEPARWTAVIVVGGDLGGAFPLGRGADLSSGTFRVVAMRDRGFREAVAQLRAAWSGLLLDDPQRYGCIVRDAKTLVARIPASMAVAPDQPLLVNVDGLGMSVRGGVRFSISGHVDLIAGPA